MPAYLLRNGLLSLILVVFFAAGSAVAGDKKMIRIGVLANRPKQIDQPHWQPLADYLAKKLPGYDVKLQLSTNIELEEALSRNRLDFIITNPTQYIQQRYRNSMSGALATLVKDENGVPVSAFGGVIITLSNRQDIVTLKDLKGKRIAAISPSGALGGYGTQAFELVKAGLKMPEDCRFIFLGQPQDQAVKAVLEGRADAAFVRTGLIEQMVQEGMLDENQIKIINRKDVPSFPYAVSTRLYPEWPFVALPHVDDDLARKIASLLLAIEHGHPSLQKAQIHGFSIPPSYESVENMMRELRMPPYDHLPVFSPADIWKRYQWPLTGLALAAVIIILLSARLGYSNRKLYIAQRKVKKSIDRYDDLVNRVPCGVYVFRIRQDGSMNLDYVSPQFCRILGLDSDVVMKDINQAFASVHPDDLEGFMNGLHEAQTNQNTPYRWEGRGYVRGEIRWIRLAADPTPVGEGGSVWNGVATDITKRKIAEELIRNLNSDLEQLVAVRTAELEYTNRELSNFCYAISHELRAPVARLQGFSNALLTDCDTEQERRFCTERIQKASIQLQTVIDSILMLSRLSRMKMDLYNTDFSGLAKEVVEELKSRGEGIRASVSIQENIVCNADKNLLKVCLSNLISNAFKYSSIKESPHVEIGISLDGNRRCFYVRDNGAGFDMQYIDKLFVPFQRLHHQDEFPGTGIGLATVQRIIERHGGQIWGEALEGSGATFYFTLDD